jgi:LysR family transcriptional regulator, glycine cleavage system transcriptional activator
MARPPLHALQGFVTAARDRLPLRAAEALHLTVSALSHQIRGLEDRIGQRLFVRTARGVELTADGRQLFDRVAGHFDALEQALQPFRTRRDDVLTISLMPSFAASWLVPRLPRFLAAHPQLEINLQSTSQLVDFERDTSIDAGVRFGRGQYPGLEAVHLLDDWVTPTASPALIARLGVPTLQTLDRFPLLGAPGGRWSEWFAQFGGTLPKRFVATFDDSDTLHRAASEGLGVALGRLTLARPLVDAGRLVLPLRERLKAEFAHYLVYPARSASHAGLHAFRDWLLAEAAADAAPPAPPRKAGPGRTRRR